MILLEPSVLESLPGRLPAPRESEEAFLKWTKLLSIEDRRLLELAMKYRLSRRQVGMAMGLAAGNVTRRIRRLRNRLHDPLVKHLCDSECTLSAEYRQVGLEHFLHDRTILEVARARRVPVIQIRHMLEFIRGWHRGLNARR